MKAGEVVAGRYRLDARLGIGGMGEVWKATHAATAREFAVKLMHTRSAGSPSARLRFAREARVSARINHPNVIDVFDAGEHDEGTLFLAMELLDGISLADAFHLAPPLTVQDLLVVLHDTARALSAAHAVGIVHRDIKPANVFLHRHRESGFATAKILDFGISKFADQQDEHQTKTGAVLGSPRYMSPEQTRSAAGVDARADLWACGVILFEGLTGTWPHEGDSFTSLVVAICTVPPASIDLAAPDLPEAVRSIVRDCLQPLERRLPTAAALADRLGAALQDPSLAERPLPRPLHAPSDSIRASSGVRVRPLISTADLGPESLRRTTSDLRPSEARAAPLPEPLGLAAPSEALAGLLMADEDAATVPIPPELIAQVFGRAAPRPLPVPPPPPARAEAKTVPLDTEMHAELVRMGLAAPVSSVPAAPTFGAPPPAPPPALAAAPPSRATPWLRFAVAALSVLLLGIVAALVSVIRAGR